MDERLVASEIMAKATSDLFGEDGVGSGSGGGGRGLGSPAASSAGSLDAPHESPAKGKDFCLQRNQLWGTIRDQSRTLQQRLEAEIKAARTTLHASDEASQKQRGNHKRKPYIQTNNSNTKKEKKPPNH